MYYFYYIIIYESYSFFQHFIISLWECILLTSAGLKHDMHTDVHTS